MIPRPTKREVVDVGHRCNIECIHCYNKHGNNTTFHTTEHLKVEISRAKERGNNHIDFTGGEPTIHPGMIDLVQHCNSLNLKCCIITNAQCGSGQLENLLKAGVDDWLISIHWNAMRNLDGSEFDAKPAQERFLRQVQEFHDGKDDRPFRFNCCLIKHNQDELVATAKWAAQWKPRIFNFVNFNPHGEWQKDVEGTKANIADLNVVETQLAAAIPILLDAGIGVNVRYYPMCRLPEAFRMHVCNDLQVPFDPYEWSYGCAPKAYKAYYDMGARFSNQNEWKAQPCLSCDLRFICGGINSAFYRACEDKSVIYAIKDQSVVRDDIYHYRRKNVICLTDRIKSTPDLCVAAIADERMAAYVPMFLYCANKHYPDCDIKVFATYRHHDDVRAVIDRNAGYGLYDGMVVKVDSEVAHYGDNPNITRALRFVEFEEYLKQYKHVLWTDIDIMIMPDGDIVKFHSDIMKVDGTGCYENYVTVHNGKRRMCGVHFITSAWWNAVSGSIKAARQRIADNPDLSWDFDEENLLKLVEESGLPEPKQKPSSIKRHHGIHIGEWVAERVGKGPAPMNNQIAGWICDLMSDPVFVKISEACSLQNDMLKTAMKIIDRVKVTRTKSQVTVKSKQPEPPKKPAMEHHEGRLLIFTACDEGYSPYIPLFKRSLELSYPEITNQVINLSEVDSPYGEYNHVPQNGFEAAAMRFLIEPQMKDEFDYFLITDIDMLIFRENISIIDQHMHHLKKDGTQCYENWVSQTMGDEIRCPGVHFVTREWWNKTRTARVDEFKKIQSDGISDYFYDEFMLGRIIKNSGLPLPPSTGALNKLWRHHGVHLGDCRLNIERKKKFRPDVFQMMHIKKLLEDAVFVELIEASCVNLPIVNKIVKSWPDIFK